MSQCLKYLVFGSVILSETYSWVDFKNGRGGLCARHGLSPSAALEELLPQSLVGRSLELGQVLCAMNCSATRFSGTRKHIWKKCS